MFNLRLIVIVMMSILISGCSFMGTKNEKRALIVISSHEQMGNTKVKTGWFLSEVTHIYYPLIKAGYKIDFASPKGGEAPMDEKSRVLTDEDNKKFLEDAQTMEKVRNTIAIDRVNPNDYKVVHFAGGHGTMWDFHNNESINKLTSSIYESGGVVSAICHGPAALVNVKLSNGDYLVKGKNMAAFTDSEEKAVKLEKVVPFLLSSKLKERGAIMHTGKNWQEQSVVDGRLVTGQNPQSGHLHARKLLDVLNSL